MEIIWKINDVPPAEKNGSGIPVFGTHDVVTPMFSITCTMVTEISPKTKSIENLSGAFIAILTARHKRRAKSTITSTAPINPSSSHIIEKIKSFCGSGMYRYF